MSKPHRHLPVSPRRQRRQPTLLRVPAVPILFRELRGEHTEVVDELGRRDRLDGLAHPAKEVSHGGNKSALGKERVWEPNAQRGRGGWGLRVQSRMKLGHGSEHLQTRVEVASLAEVDEAGR